jgi:hypothetical protein
MSAKRGVKQTYPLTGKNTETLLVQRVAPAYDLVEHAHKRDLFFGWPGMRLACVTRAHTHNAPHSPPRLVLCTSHRRELRVHAHDAFVRALRRRAHHVRLDVREHAAAGERRAHRSTGISRAPRLAERDVDGAELGAEGEDGRARLERGAAVKPQALAQRAREKVFFWNRRRRWAHVLF